MSYPQQCVCGTTFLSRYRDRAKGCPSCRIVRRQIIKRQWESIPRDQEYLLRRKALHPVYLQWRHFAYIENVLFGPTANIKCSLDGFLFPVHQTKVAVN